MPAEDDRNEDRVEALARAGQMTAPEVWIDQEACTGDGLCVEEAPDVFELDIDGLAYVKGDDGELRAEAGATVPVPVKLLLDVVESARRCPGDCIYVRDSASA